jgi:hypothetical protein
MLHTIILAIAGVEGGRACRACGDPIHPRDDFGLSEYVCRSCRDA